MNTNNTSNTEDQDIHQMDIKTEIEANRLLASHGAFSVSNGIFRENHMNRKIINDNAKAINQGADIQWCESVILDGYGEQPRVTLAELIEAARLTPRQRNAVRLMIELRSQTAVARAMSIRRPAVSKLLHRAFIKVHIAYPRMQIREPFSWVWQLWYDEMRLKRRLIYRKHVTRKK